MTRAHPQQTRRPVAPAGLTPRGRGRRLWRATIHDYDLTPPETILLGEICRIVDRLGALEVALTGEPAVVRGSTGQPKAHPILGEIRAQQTTLARLVDSLHIDTDEPNLTGLLTHWDREHA